MNLARIPLSKVHSLPAEYAMELHAVGKINGDALLLPLVDAHAIKIRYRGQNTEPQKIRGLGDLIHKFAAPIAKALKLPCIDQKTQQLRPESPCAKRREELNKAMPL